VCAVQRKEAMSEKVPSPSAAVGGRWTIDICPDCGAPPFQHPLDPPWLCKHRRDCYVPVEVVPASSVEGLVEALEAVVRNDATPTYTYDEARPDGERPGTGRRWNTPRELARSALAAYRQERGEHDG
jgi:hypothetical protein